jgi:hypothetical protein
MFEDNNCYFSFFRCSPLFAQILFKLKWSIVYMNNNQSFQINLPYMTNVVQIYFLNEQNNFCKL